MLAGLIESHAMPMLYQGNVAVVTGWFERMPKSLLYTSPMIGIARAWSLALMERRATDRAAIEQALQAAEEALKRVNAPETLRNLIAGHAASIHAFSIDARVLLNGNPEQLIAIAQQAQRLLPEAETAIRSVNAMIIGNGYARLGDLPAAERAFQQTFADGVAGLNYYAAIYGPINLILIALIKGALSAALELCEANIDRFNRLLAGQRFPPIGALSVLKGCVLLEQSRLAEAEQELTQGLSLLQWTGEFRTHLKGYTALARLRGILGDWSGAMENLRLLEAARPEGALYAQALRQRLAVRDPAGSNLSLEEARLWLSHAAIRFDALPDLTGVDPITETLLRTHLSVAHIVARLAARNPRAYALADVQRYLARQETIAQAHDLAGWLIEIWLARALIDRLEGSAESALGRLQLALGAAAA
ncbi:MAG TPA: hypothetical protein VFT99_07270, partial [Roseiflexaceae bacterium]|nr:hypothetical protein [Roseiflexaceae bacterium]